jgi:MFS family permease
LIHKLVTGAIAATITAVTAAIAAAVTAAIAATVTAAIAAAVTAAIAATVTAAIAATIDTARRRRRRSIDLAAAATVIATAAPVIAATGAHRAKERGTEQRRSKEEAKCFGLGRNGGGASAGCVIVVAAFEAPAVVTGLDDVTVVGQAVEQRGRHLGIWCNCRRIVG